MVLIPKLMMSVLLGLAATAFAALEGYGLLSCLLIYSMAGQAAFIPLVAVGLVQDNGQLT